MLILTDLETAPGFRLAGLEVREATSENATDALQDIVETDEYGLVVVDVGLVADPVAATERVMRDRDLPVLLSMPSLGVAFGETDDATAYMKGLVRSAIGFDIKLE
jgi:V/A-type H+-transporting ATPase subunit F